MLLSKAWRCRCLLFQVDVHRRKDMLNIEITGKLKSPQKTHLFSGPSQKVDSFLSSEMHEKPRGNIHTYVQSRNKQP